MVLYLDYIKKIQENNYIEWDIKTITAGDYTIEFDIDPDFFDDFLVKEYTNWTAKQSDEKGIQYESRMAAFRDWIQYEMEQRLDQMPDLGYEEKPVDHIKIAVTSFAYNNPEIIHLLKERGDIIKSEKWTKMADIDNKINEFKDEKFMKLISPCSIFMTFECEEVVNRALSYYEAIETHEEELGHLKTWLGDHEIEI